jgi:valyl-tRNA synthetase
LEIIDIFNEDATLSFGLHFKVKIVLWFIGNCQKLETIGALAKQKYLNKVGTSERTKAVIEPRLSTNGS